MSRPQGRKFYFSQTPGSACLQNSQGFWPSHHAPWMVPRLPGHLQMEMRLTVLLTSISPHLFVFSIPGQGQEVSLSLSLSFPSCPELPSPAEHIYQYPDGPRMYTRASHTGSHRGHPWQTVIVLARFCGSLSCLGATFPECGFQGQLLGTPLLPQDLAVPIPES